VVGCVVGAAHRGWGRSDQGIPPPWLGAV
jgi:hypothetical protein